MIGGKIEPGESAVETVLRECQEEIGCRPSLLWRSLLRMFFMSGKKIESILPLPLLLKLMRLRS